MKSKISQEAVTSKGWGVREHFNAFLLSLLVVFLLGSRSIDHPFFSDDIVLIPQNPTSQHHSPLTALRLLRINYWCALDLKGKPFQLADDDNLYRPTTSISLWINSRLFGISPRAYRVVNLLLCALAAAAVGGLASLKTSDRAGLIACLLVAAHPTTVDVVNRIVGRADILVLLGTAFSAFLAEKSRHNWSLTRSVALATCLLLTMGAKESGVIAPILVISFSLIGSKEQRFDRLPTLIAALTFLVYVGARLAVVGFPHYQSAPEADLLANPLIDMEWSARLPGALANAFWYIHMLILPWPMRATYRPDQLPRITDVSVILGMMCVVVLAAALLWLLMRMRTQRIGQAAALPIAWWLLCFLVVGQAFFTIGTYRDVRLVYPFLGSFAMWVACGIYVAEGRSNDRGRIAMNKRTQAPALWPTLACFGLGCVFVILSLLRSEEYSSEIRLMENDRDSDPTALTHLILGTLYINSGKSDLALREKEQAVAKAPQSSQALTDLAALRMELGRVVDAESLLVKAIKLSPHNSIALMTMGVLQMRKGDMAEAEAFLRLAEHERPENITIQLNAAYLDALRGRQERALGRLQWLIATGLPDARFAQLGQHIRSVRP